NCTHVVIDGLTGVNSQRYAFLLGAGDWDGSDPFIDPVANITVRNCVAHDCGLPGTWPCAFYIVGASHDVTIDHCEAFASGQGFGAGTPHQTDAAILRSEERRVGKECGCGGAG